jgi:hypothetical protein
MASNFDIASSIDATDLADFIPEVWALETVAAYKANLVMARLVSLIPHVGKKGDVIHIPAPSRGSAAAKAKNTVVSLITYADTAEKSVTIDQHYHYARLLEDVAEIQGLPSIRRFFTDDAGYALAKQSDLAIGELAKTWGGGTAYSKSVIGSDGSTNWSQASSGNGAALTDAGLRRVMQTFDDEDVPGRDRFLVLPPIEKRKLLGEGRFTEQAFVGEVGQGNSIRNGLVGDLYGFEIYVSSNAPQTQANDSSVYNVCLAFQRDSLVLAEQLTPRVQEQYKLEALGTLVVADALYGVSTIRGNVSGEDGRGCKGIVVPNS